MKEARVLIGFHAVLARLRADPDSVLEILADETRHDARIADALAAAEARGVRVMRVPPRRLDGFYGGGRHQGIVARVRPRDEHADLDGILARLKEPPLLLVLDGVTDPHNLGACLRSADAFGAHAVVVPKDRAAGINATVAKAASGAADTVPVIAVTNLARALREMKAAGLWIVGAEAGGESLFTADLAGPMAWVLGAEGEGLRRLTREHCDRMVGIPIGGSVASLNVSVAAGICLFATRRARSASAGTMPR
jgi:23S rRNA (guanosine2251-2'-O)-methyltransferase